MGRALRLNKDLPHQKGVLYISDSKKYYGSDIALAFIDEEDYIKCKKFGWYIDPKGYVFTRFNGKKLTLHRFIMNVEGKITVDHDDGNKLNNRKSNLILMSCSDNLLKSWHKQKQREHFKKPVAMIDKDTNETLRVFDSVKNAAIFAFNIGKSKHINQGAISNVCNKIRKSACGYKWEWR